MQILTEKTFEAAITEDLITERGWLLGDAEKYNRELALFPETILQFIQDTQANEWDKISKIHGDDVNEKIIQRLCKELELKGTLEIVRNGFTDYGCKFKMAYFKPESGLNPETIEQYNKIF